MLCTNIPSVPLTDCLSGASSDALRSPTNSRDVEVSLKHQCLVWEGGKDWLSRPCSWLKLWKELDERIVTEFRDHTGPKQKAQGTAATRPQ